MTKYYKAVTEDYKDFYSGEVDYSVGNVVEHHEPGTWGDEDAAGYLSVTTDPADVPGMAGWPLRVLEVEVEYGWNAKDFDHKICTHKLTVLREVEPWRFFGPHGELVMRMAEQVNTLTDKESSYLLARLRKVQDAETFYQFQHKVLYSFRDRMSAYEIRKLVDSTTDIYTVLEGVAVSDLLGNKPQQYVEELVAEWDRFFSKTPIQLFLGRVKEFFTL